MTLFEQCVDALTTVLVHNGEGRLTNLEADDARSVTRAVLETLIANTPSPRTVDELTRVLAEAE